MSSTSPRHFHQYQDQSPSPSNQHDEVGCEPPCLNISISSPEIMHKFDEEHDHSLAKITTSDQSHSLETNISSMGRNMTPKQLEFSPGGDVQLFSPNKNEEDRRKSVSRKNLNLTVIIEKTTLSGWNKGVGCQSAVRTSTSPSLKFTKNEVHPSCEITSRASSHSKDCSDQRPTHLDLLSDRLDEKERNHRESLSSTTKAQALTSSRTNSQISQSRNAPDAQGENRDTVNSYQFYPGQGEQMQCSASSKIFNGELDDSNQVDRQKHQSRAEANKVSNTQRREDNSPYLEEMNEEELNDMVQNQVLFEGIEEVAEDCTFSSKSNRSRKQSAEDFTTKAKLLNSRRTSFSSIGSQTRRNLESRLKIVNLNERPQSIESNSIGGSDSCNVSNEQFKSKLKIQAEKIHNLRRQSTLQSRVDSLDSFQMDVTNIKSHSPVIRRQSTFSPQRRGGSPYTSSPTSSKASGSPSNRNKRRQSPANLLNIRNCALRRGESPVQKKPRSKFSGENHKKESDDRYAQYYESREEGDSNIDSFDLQDFFKEYKPQATQSCKSQEEIREELVKEEELNSSESEESKEEETSSIDQVDNNECTKELYEEHMVGMYKALVYLKTIERPTEEEILKRKVPLPRLQDKNLKTLVFDLDETLIHCVDNIELQKPDKILMVDIPGVGVKRAGINIRPLALQCLEFAHEHFEVIVFTASHRAYADAVLDYLDPHQQYIDYRLYREHCVQTKHKIYMKDLRVLGNRDLNKVTIIDNHVYSFGFQLDNGIPILPFYDDKEDIELKLLISYFKKLMKCKDVRNVHRKHFEFTELLHKNIENFIRFYDQDSDDEEEDLTDSQVQQIADHLTGHSDRALHHNDSSGSSHVHDSNSDENDDSYNGDAGSGGVDAAAIHDVQADETQEPNKINLQKVDTTKRKPAPRIVPNIREKLRRVDTITQFKSPDYLQQNPLKMNKPLTPRQNGNKAKSEFNKIMKGYPKIKLTLQSIQDSEDDNVEEEKEVQAKRKVSEISGLEKSHSDNSPDLLTLIGKLISPDGKPLLKKPKSGRESRQKGGHRKEEPMNQDEYLKVLEKMEIGAGTGNCSQLTRTDTVDEMENSFQVIQDFISKSKGCLVLDSEQ